MACAPLPRSVIIPGWPEHSFSIFVTVRRTVHLVTISGQDMADPVKQQRILNAVLETINVFEKQEGVTVPSTVIGVTDAPKFPCGSVTQPICAGCWCVESGLPETILVWVGDNQEIPPLYHELAHRTFCLFGHDDPRWYYFDLRGAQISAILAKK